MQIQLADDDVLIRGAIPSTDGHYVAGLFARNIVMYSQRVAREGSIAHGVAGEEQTDGHDFDLQAASALLTFI